MSKQPSPEDELYAPASAFRAFVEKAGGTLPEVITEQDLATLNEGLRLFFAELRLGLKWLHTGEGLGSDSVVLSLDALWQFVALFKRPREEGLHLPAQHLIKELRRDLPKRGGNKAPDIHDAMQGYAAAAVEQLAGRIVPRMELNKAYAEVFKILKRHGVRPLRGGGALSLRTIRSWREKIRKDVKRKRKASVQYDHKLFEDKECLAALSPAEARRWVRNSLDNFLRRFAPFLRHPTNPLE